jgi:hypothetical protein
MNGRLFRNGGDLRQAEDRLAISERRDSEEMLRGFILYIKTAAHAYIALNNTYYCT